MPVVFTLRTKKLKPIVCVTTHYRPTKMLRLLTTFLLVSLTTAWPWDTKPEVTLEDCGSERSAIFKVLLTKITQNVSDPEVYHPNKLSEVTVMYANDDKTYKNIQVEFSYSLNGIPMPTHREDGCEHGLPCPQIPGEYIISREIQFPMIPGKTKAEILWKSYDTTLLCLRAMIFVPVLNVLRWR